jgi:uncharacterized protein YbjT (DUF2867 family)
MAQPTTSRSGPGPVLVLGATGRTGGATARHLLAAGVAVRAVTRRPDATAAIALAAAGAEVVRADLDQPASLGPAFAGVASVFNVQAGFDDRGRYDAAREIAQGQAVAHACAAAGVEHVVTVSAGFGPACGLAHFDAKAVVRRAFEDAGTAVTSLHPGPFMELMTDRSFAPALSTWGAEPRVVGWDHPLPWIAVDDVGAAAARCLAEPARWAGRSLALVGDRRSLRACRALLAAAGRRPRRVPVPVAIFRRMVGDELPDMWSWMVTGLDDAAVEAALATTRDVLAAPRTVEAWIDGRAFVSAGGGVSSRQENGVRGRTCGSPSTTTSTFSS